MGHDPGAGGLEVRVIGDPLRGVERGEIHARTAQDHEKSEEHAPALGHDPS
jgi:hypothetical protein